MRFGDLNAPRKRGSYRRPPRTFVEHLLSPSLRGGEVGGGWHILSLHKVQRCGRVEPASRNRLRASSGVFPWSESVEKSWDRIRLHFHSIQARSMQALVRTINEGVRSDPGRPCPNQQYPDLVQTSMPAFEER